MREESRAKDRTLRTPHLEDRRLTQGTERREARREVSQVLGRQQPKEMGKWVLVQERVRWDQ